MKSEFNRILVIIMKDGERHVSSVPNNREPEELLKDIISTSDFDEKNYKTNYFFPFTAYGINDYLNFFNEETKSIDDKALSLNFKIEEVKKHRNYLFSVLDIEFMKSLEEDNPWYKEHIVKMKNYLRDLPRNIATYGESLSIEDIVEFNAFNNIFKLDIIYSGKGYNKPPKVTIDPPAMSGFQAEAVGAVNEGKLSNAYLTKIGSGYMEIPKVVVSPPDEEDGEVAIVSASPPENDIYTIRQILNKIKSKE